MTRILALLLLACAAVGLALFMGDSHASVALFWPPYRLSVSLNLFLFALLAFFVLLFFAMRALQLFLAMPSKAQNWRAQYHERAMYQQLLDAHVQLWTGRFSRAGKAAGQALEHIHKQEGQAEEALALEGMMAHLLAAESAHQLRDTAQRQHHAQRVAVLAAEVGEAAEAATLRAAQWALDDGEPKEAWAQLQGLPQGAQRRVHALRLKLRTAQGAGRSAEALETARLLIKHNAFSPFVAQTLQLGLIRDYLAQAQDLSQLQAMWKKLARSEQEMPEVAYRAAERMLQLSQQEDDRRLVRERLEPLLNRYASLPEHLQTAMVLTLEACLDQPERDWLLRIEKIQAQYPRDLRLRYLAAVVYLHSQLWGKAQAALQEFLGPEERAQSYPELSRRACMHLARLAESQGEGEKAHRAWRRAALLSTTVLPAKI